MAENVEVISFLMGSNKTNGIIDWMNKNSDERYIYIVPNLSELEDTELHKSRILSIGFEVLLSARQRLKRRYLRSPQRH